MKECLKKGRLHAVLTLLVLFGGVMLSSTGSMGKVSAAWYDDYNYETSGNIMYITESKGSISSDTVTVPATVTKDGQTYTVCLKNKNAVSNGYSVGSSLWAKDTRIKEINLSQGVLLDSNCNSLFAGMENLERVDLSGADSSNVKIMSYMFNNASVLLSVDFGSINTAEVTTMKGMFESCPKLVTIDASALRSSKLLNSQEMFYGVGYNIQELDLSNFLFPITTNPASDSTNMLRGSSVYDLYLPEAIPDGWDISNASTLKRVYYAGTQSEWNEKAVKLPSSSVVVICNHNGMTKTSPDESHADTTDWYKNYKYAINKKNKRLKITSYTGSSATSITVPAYTKINGVTYTTVIDSSNNTSGYNKASIWNSVASTLSTLVLKPGVEFSQDSKYMFANLQKLSTITLAGVNTSDVFDMSNMFFQCYALKNIDLSDFDTSNVKNYSSMFQKVGVNVTATSINIQNFDINGSVNSMFSSASVNNIYLPEKWVKNQDFTSVSNLKNIYYAGSQTQWTNLNNTVGSSVTINYNSSGGGGDVIPVNVTYDYNGGTGSATGKTVNVGETYGTLPSPTRNGYAFDGWYTAASGGSLVTATTKVTNTSNHTLYAHWTANTYTVTFNANGGTVSPTSNTYTYGSAYTDLPTPTYSGYSFDGWYTAASGGTKVTTSSIYSTVGAQTLYAHWTAASTTNTFTVTLDANGGTVSTTSFTVTNGGTYRNLKDPYARTGYTFNGWYTERTGGTQITTSTTVQLTSNQTLYAHWTARKYKVTFNPNGGSVTETSRQIDYESAYGDLPTPTYAGHTFVGWYTKASGGDKIFGTTIFKSTTNITIYAHWEADTYTVTFDANGGTVSPTKKTYTYGSAYADLPTPTNPGYSFAGWYTAISGGTKITESSVYSTESNQTLYAHWTTSTYTINLDANGGSVATTSFTVSYGGTYSNLGDPNPRTGYTFVGWYTAKTGGTQITASTRVEITSNQTLYARWTANTKKVTFNPNGGSVTPTYKNVSYDSEYGELPTPEYTGHTFDGWFTAQTSGNRVLESTIFKSTTDTTIYAHWITNRYTVTYDANGGSVDKESFTVAYGAQYGNLEQPTRTGYNFDGWYTAKTGGTLITSETTMSKLADHTIYAHWTAKKYTISFDINLSNESSSINSQQVTYGGTYGTLPSPSVSGYTFNGWYTDKTSGSKITSSTSVNITSNQTLYAHWTAATPKVTFNANGGSVSVASKTYTFGSKYASLPTPTRSGYTFTGWYTAKTNGTRIYESTTVNIATDHTLYAMWSNNSYKVTFNPNGGTVTPESVNVVSDDFYGELPIPEYQGHTFEGWYTSTSGGTLITESSVVTITDDQILYAHWSVNNYTVSFDAGDGEDVTDTISVVYGQSYGDLPIASRTGYTLTGWYTAKTGGTLVKADSIVELTSDITLYARWTANTYNVSYNGNGVSLNYGVKKVTYNDLYGELKTPERDGYTFLGWFTSASGGEEVTATSRVLITDNQTLYAHWSVMACTVTFDPNGGSVRDEIKMVEYGKQYGTLPVPTLPGSTFVGWYTSKTGGTQVTDKTTVQQTSDHTIYARWTKNKYTLTFNANGGNVTPTSKQIEYDVAYGELPTPTKTGYSFDGWHTAISGGTKVTESTKLTQTSAQTIYAHWKANTYTVTYDINADTGSISSTSKQVTYDATYGELETPTRTGYNFDGWYDEFGNKISSDSIVNIAKDHSIYASWTAKTVAVTFNPNGGTMSGSRNVDYTYGGNYTDLPVPYKEYCEFAGWYTAKTGGTKVTSSTQVLNESAHTLIARWNPITVVVTFNANGGNVTKTSANVTAGETYGELPTPTRSGYTFGGWYTSSNDGTRVFSETKVTTTAAHSIYAHWTKTNTTTYVDITYDANGGMIDGREEVTLQLVQGSSYDLPVIERENYTFDGWYDSEEGGTKITSVDKAMTTRTLWAHWTRIVYKVNVIYNANGGSVSSWGKEVTVDSTYGGFDTPVRTGYNFEGWFTTQDGGTEVIATTTVTNKDDHVIYAHWTHKTVQVTFNANGGVPASSSATLSYGDTYGASMPEVTREDYVFVGWFTSGSGGERVYNDDVMWRDTDHILYAHWVKEARNVQVTFNANGGNVETSVKEVTYGEVYGTLPTPARAGYVFTGWFTEVDEGEIITSDTTVTDKEAHTLYAHWTEQIITVTLKDGEEEVETYDRAVGGIYGNLPMPERDGYDFVGWFTAPEGGSEILFNTVVEKTSDHEIYARWEKAKVKITVTFDANNGEVEVNDKLVVSDTAYGELPEAQREGYLFLGWYTEQKNGERVDEETICELQDSHTLYAQWWDDTAPLWVKVSFDMNYGEGIVGDTKVQYSSSYGELPELERDGFRFDGWFTKADDGDLITAESIVEKPYNHVLYAHWTDLSTLVEPEPEPQPQPQPQPVPGQTTPQGQGTTQAPQVAVGTSVADESTGQNYVITSTDSANPTVSYAGPIDTKAKKVKVPDTVTLNGVTYKVTKVADNAFKNNKAITEITLGNNITEIGSNAFAGAKNLKKVTVGSNITTIGANAFNGCSKLRTIIIKSKKLNKKKLHKKAFKGIKKSTVIKVHKSKVKAYKKLFRSKGLSKKVKVKKY
ncbi:MAG: InlB B-repeat-containing protein [Lachnospiraceae bacterium]|nr:InlB B-repeat-containing protein [Lachnospiraceae bacterium]